LRILIDEGVPVQIRRALTGHSATTVQEAGWGSFMNGDLLAIADGSYDVFITADKNLKYQQNLTGRKLRFSNFQLTGGKSSRITSAQFSKRSIE
jgi:hypothetical protein